MIFKVLFWYSLTEDLSLLLGIWNICLGLEYSSDIKFSIQIKLTRLIMLRIKKHEKPKNIDMKHAAKQQMSHQRNQS